MSSPPRILLPKTVAFITTRTQEGLPFVPTEFMGVILSGILARAQELHPVRVISYLFMANHLHLLVYVEEPEDVVGFMDRIKTESAHVVNRLLGRRVRSVWQEGYDSPTVLTPDDVVNKLVYIYTNPQTAGLVDNIDDYPGLSSWGMFVSGKQQMHCRRICRNAISPMATTALSIKQSRRFAAKLLTASRGKLTFTLTPESWLDCFGITDPSKRRWYKTLVIERVRQHEVLLREQRAKAKTDVIGPAKLVSQAVDKPYTPKKFSRRMWCICSDRALRIRFILFIKGLIAEGRLILAQWRKGLTQLRYPPGLFPPSMPKLVNLLPVEFV